MAVGAGALLAAYLTALWPAPRPWWKPARTLAFSAAVVAASLGLRYGYHGPAGDLLAPLVGLMAWLGPPVLPTVVAACAGAAFLLSSRSYSGAIPAGSLAGLAGLYLAIRGRGMREEAYRRSRDHLRELREAHEALPEAMVESMRSAALRCLVAQMQARSPLRLRFDQQSETSEWSVETSVVLYRILQESLTNVLRHSHAPTATVRIEESAGRVVLTVSDDGQSRGGSRSIPGSACGGSPTGALNAGGRGPPRRFTPRHRRAFYPAIYPPP